MWCPSSGDQRRRYHRAMASAPVDTSSVTAEQLLAMGSGRRELIDGRVIEMEPTGAPHGRASAAAALEIGLYAREHGGVALGAETGFTLSEGPDTVRAPDAAYIPADRIGPQGLPAGFFPGAPDLAVEVVSPRDTQAQTQDKALMWLDHGASVVLLVDPQPQRVTRYRSREDITVLEGDRTVDCTPAMPGFAPTAASLLG